MNYLPWFRKYFVDAKNYKNSIAKKEPINIKRFKRFKISEFNKTVSIDLDKLDVYMAYGKKEVEVVVNGKDLTLLISIEEFEKILKEHELNKTFMAVGRG